MRRPERELISWYQELLVELRLRLTPDNHAVAVQIATAPDRLSGSERLKLDGAAKARDFVPMKMKELEWTRVLGEAPGEDLAVVGEDLRRHPVFAHG